MSRLVSHPSKEDLHANTKNIISRKQKADKVHNDKAASKWKDAVSKIIQRKLHYQEHTRVAWTEHMSSVDPFHGERIRKGEPHRQQSQEFDSDDLLVITPAVDGRLKDEGRP